MKWNPNKGKTSLPASFLNAYPIRQSVVVTPDNYLNLIL